MCVIKFISFIKGQIDSFQDDDQLKKFWVQIRANYIMYSLFYIKMKIFTKLLPFIVPVFLFAFTLLKKS